MAADPGAGKCEVWPENWATWCFFMEHLQTQWRVGAAGPVGLDYGVLQWLFKVQEVEDEREMLDGLKVIEATILKLWAEEAAA